MVFNKLKISYYLASSMNSSENYSDFSDSQILEKMQKLIRKLPRRFANCEWRTANSNTVIYTVLSTLSEPLAVKA